MRSQVLNALKQGISRIRVKGGADPSSLYDLLNGYVTIDGSVVSRPGTRQDVLLPAGTKGLCAFNGGFTVFSHVSTPISDSRYICEVLVNPNDSTQPIKEIHFAAPFMGYLYVVAEFDNGDVIHYWLQGGESWSADHAYGAGDIVEPTTRNGLAYRAIRSGAALPAWAPNVRRAVGDQVEPTVYNDYYYTVTEADGDNPASGSTEPNWLTSEGALVYEDVDTTPQPTSPTTTPKKPLNPRYGDNAITRIVLDVSGADQ